MEENNKELHIEESENETSMPSNKNVPRAKIKKALMIKIGVWVGVALVLLTAIGVSVFFAVRSGAKITVYFNTQVAELDSIEIKKGDIPILPVIQQEGYDFLGWYTQDDVLADADFFRRYDFLHDIELHAVWHIGDPVTITYVSRGGTNVDPVEIARGTAPRVMGQSERTGYYLLGWCLDEYCLRVFNPDYDVVNENLTLYAKWMPKTIDEDSKIVLSYNVGNGSPINSINLTMGDTIPIETTHYEGHVFDGWYVDPAYKYPVTSDMIVTLACSIYAKWVKTEEKPQLTIYTPVGAPVIEPIEYAYDHLISDSEVSAPEWDNHVFMGFFYNDQYTDVVSYPFYISENIYFYAKYRDESPDYVTVYYYDDVNHATSILYQSGTSLQFYVPEKEGYMFDGWYSDSDYSLEFDFVNTKASYDLCLYAKWTPLNPYVDEAFYYKLSEDGTYLIAVSLVNPQVKELIVPDFCDGLPIKELSDGLFATCPIEKITIGENVKRIGAGTFKDSYLVSIDLPVNVIEIAENAFYHAYNLKTVVAHGQVNVGEYAFYRCETLKSVDFSYAKDIGDYAFSESGIEEAVLTYILDLGHSAFKNCYSLRSVDFAQSTISSIKVDTFRNCIALKNISLPHSVKSLNNGCFNASGLSVINTNGVEIIDNSVFMGCESLEKVTIGRELQSVQVSAFADCSALTMFKVNNGNSNYKTFEGDGSLYNADGTRLILYAGASDNYVLPSSVGFISQSAFILANYLKSVTVQDGNLSFKSINGNLFTSDGYKLVYFADTTATEYTIPDDVKSIGSMAFSRKRNLCRVYLSNKIEKVDYWAFYDDTSLSEIICPNEAIYTLIAENLNQENVPTAVYCCPMVNIVVEG